jgi:hypothetical protein
MQVLSHPIQIVYLLEVGHETKRSFLNHIHNNKLSVFKGLCQICLDKGQLLGLACAHLFCTECWTNYLQQAVLADGRIIVQCPADQCTVAVDEDFVRARLKVKGDDKALEKLARIQLNSFVEVSY